MPGGLSTLTLAEQLTIALAVVLVILLAIFGYRAYLRSRITPEERERRRRAWLVATGKMGDAILVEVREQLIFYSYLVRGVEYTASQDIAPLAEKLPGGLGANGPVSVKYDPRNPANSIVIAEEWTGLR
jgi:hypothetical protein